MEERRQSCRRWGDEAGGRIAAAPATEGSAGAAVSLERLLGLLEAGEAAGAADEA